MLEEGEQLVIPAPDLDLEKKEEKEVAVGTPDLTGDTTQILDEAAMEEYETKLAAKNMVAVNITMNTEQDALKKELGKFESSNKS